MNATSGWDARINSAIGEVVTEGSNVNVGVDASGNGVTSVDLAVISIVAVVFGVGTKSSGNVARVIRAHVVVVAIDGSGNALSSLGVADVVLACDSWASNVDAHVARSGGEKDVLAPRGDDSSNLARVGVTGVSKVAVDWRVGASNVGITSSSVANVNCVTSDVGVRASGCWGANSCLALVAVVAWLGSVDASVSIDVWSARLGRAEVVVLAT